MVASNPFLGILSAVPKQLRIASPGWDKVLWPTAVPPGGHSPCPQKPRTLRHTARWQLQSLQAAQPTEHFTPAALVRDLH